ncbi:MAG: DUF4333 domain-containing protein [Nodosilinea sp.]
MVFRRFTIGLVFISALGLAACGNRLDVTDVETNIKADIERQGRRLSLTAVRCPRNVSRQEGAYFRCVGELDPEGIFTINVTQQDSQGNVTWEVPNSKVLLNLPAIEDTIQQGLSQTFGQRALVDCGTATYRVNQPGDRFECQVVGGIETESAMVESVLVKIDPDGNLNWQELQSATAATAVVLSQGPTAAATAGASVSAPTAAAPPANAAAKTTTVTGPTGRVINRPYIPGDRD